MYICIFKISTLLYFNSPLHKIQFIVIKAKNLHMQSYRHFQQMLTKIIFDSWTFVFRQEISY